MSRLDMFGGRTKVFALFYLLPAVMGIAFGFFVGTWAVEVSGASVWWGSLIAATVSAMFVIGTEEVVYNA